LIREQKPTKLKREQRGKLIAVLKEFKLTIVSFRPLEEAIITPRSEYARDNP
jgi:predicted flavoprotein YhiN